MIAAAAARLVHVRQAGARGEKCAVEMDREHLLPFGVGELLERMHDLDAGIAHQDVDAAERRDHRRHAGVDGFFVRHVHRDADRLAAAA